MKHLNLSFGDGAGCQLRAGDPPGGGVGHRQPGAHGQLRDRAVSRPLKECYVSCIEEGTTDGESTSTSSCRSCWPAPRFFVIFLRILPGTLMRCGSQQGALETRPQPSYNKLRCSTVHFTRLCSREFSRTGWCAGVQTLKFNSKPAGRGSWRSSGTRRRSGQRATSCSRTAASCTGSLAPTRWTASTACAWRAARCAIWKDVLMISCQCDRVCARRRARWL